MKYLAEKLRAFGEGRYLENEPMARHTTFRVGGPADMMFFPANEEELIFALNAACEAGVSCCVVGNGSNLIVRDGGIRGLVVVLGDDFSEIRVEGNTITAKAGAMLARVSVAAQENGLSGLEFAGGIPGTLGGGCMMNAGAYGGQLSDVLESAQLLIDGRVETYSCEQMQMGYRTSYPLRCGGIVLSAKFVLRPDDPDAVYARMRELNRQRRDKQPLNFPSAGSVFKRPEGYFAGALIEQCGLKGETVGGAQVSPKHAGFIVNIGGATAKDILDLVERVQKIVLANTGVQLEMEIRVLGEA